MPNPDLDESIIAGQAGHISDHQIIHDLINDVDAPFILRGDHQGTLAAAPAAGVSGRYYFATDDNGGIGQLYRDDGATWRAIGPSSSAASFSSGTYAARPAAGTANRYYFATDHKRLYRDTAAAWQAPNSEFINVLDVGADPTGVADSWAAFKAAIESFGSPSNAVGGTILVPPGTYRFSKSLHINRQIVVLGTAMGEQTRSGCKLVFDTGIHGVIVDSAYEATENAGLGDLSVIQNLNITAAGKTVRNVTDGVTTATSTTLTSATANFTAADVGKAVISNYAQDYNQVSAIFPGTYIVSVQSATQCTLSHFSRLTATGVFVSIGAGCGVVMNGKVRLSNVAVDLFGGHGVEINTDIPYSNANGWVLDNVWSRANSGNGFHVMGGDSNAGIATGCLAGANGGSGFFDAASAANTYLGCETLSNVLFGYEVRRPIGGGTLIGCYAEGEAVRTEGNVMIVGGGLSSGVTSGSRRHARAGYLAFNGNINTIAAAPLRVTGAGVQEVHDGVATAGSTTFTSATAAFVAGDVGEEIRILLAGVAGWGNQKGVHTTTIASVTNATTVVLTTATPSAGTALSFDVKRFPKVHTQIGSSDPDTASLRTLQFGSDDGGGRYFLRYDGGTDPTYGGWWFLDWEGVGNAIGFSNNKAAEGYGHVTFPQGIHLGNSSTRRHLDNGTAAPTTGAHLRGEIVLRRDPSAGGKIGWVCTADGTPGTWKEWGIIDA